MRIYLASSWRNPYQPDAVIMLRIAGHTVYDFQHPEGGDHLGFSWSTIDPSWQSWGDRGREDGLAAYRRGIQHPVAQAGYESDMEALGSADVTVLLLPTGRSAHLELGYAAALGQRTAVWVPSAYDFNPLFPMNATPVGGQHAVRREFEPELMYRMVGLVTDSLAELVGWLGAANVASARVHGVRCSQPVWHAGACGDRLII